uniref:TIR domain-containing protein n=1 Tax=Kordia sp. TaxID=1965332 RepID=UPI003D6BB7A6
IENLDKLTNLSKLYIYNNEITNIENLDKLTNLSILNIYNNQITKIENIKLLSSIASLKKLTIHNNPFIEDQGLVISEFGNHLDIIKSELQKLQETQISIQLPVKVMLLGNHASGKSTLLKYLQTQQCSKVEKDKNSSTHVLSVEHSIKFIDEKYKLPKAIYYDFGGQDYYHGVYQAFFTQEAINLLVWNPKSDVNELLAKDSKALSTRNYNRAYWLAQLQYAFLKRNQNLAEYDDPLLLIQTHADEHTAKHNWNEAFDKNQVIDEFHISLNIDFKSLKNDAGLQYLTATFWDTVVHQAKTKEEPHWYPKFIRYIIDNNSSKAIPLDTIIKYFNREITAQFTVEDKQKSLRAELEQLSRKGMLLYYKEDKLLNDVAWLNPSATVANIHKTVLSEKSIRDNKGRLTTKEFQKLGVTDKIERLLLKEKVLFFDKGNNEYIIPNYLPLTSEDDEVYNLLKFDFNKPTFVLKFERFIPFGFINQLICYYGQNPEKKQYWRDQLIFTYYKEFKVWIQLDFSKLTISVSVKPKTSKHPKLNDVVKKLFREILYLYWSKEVFDVKLKDLGSILKKPTHNQIKIGKKFIKGFTDNFLSTSKSITDIPDDSEHNVMDIILEYRQAFEKEFREDFEKLTKPKDLYISTDNEYFVHYNTLDDPKTKESIASFPLKEEKKDGKVTEFYLDKTNPRAQRSYKYRNFTDNENIKQMKKIFISYSREDVDYKNELRKHLNMLKRFDVADNWSCEDITIGKWHDQIQKELEESDLVIFMLSINFFNSQYILEQEVVHTMNAIANGSDKKVYSIIVSDFPGLENFDSEDLDETQKSILKLGDYQYGMYAQEKSVVSGNTKERIISLKEASNRGIIDTQLTKIVTKIMKDIK